MITVIGEAKVTHNLNVQLVSCVFVFMQEVVISGVKTLHIDRRPPGDFCTLGPR